MSTTDPLWNLVQLEPNPTTGTNNTLRTVKDETGKNLILIDSPSQVVQNSGRYSGAAFNFIGNASVNNFINTLRPISFGTGDFCLEMDVFLRSNYAVLVDSDNGSVYGWQIYIRGTGELTVYAGNSYRHQTGTIVPLNTWSHIRWCRIAGVSRIFMNGIQLDADRPDTTNYAWNSIFFGSQANTSVRADAMIDNIRITVGSGRSASNFTPGPLPGRASNQDILQTGDLTFLTTWAKSSASNDYTPDVGNYDADYSYPSTLSVANNSFPIPYGGKSLFANSSSGRAGISYKLPEPLGAKEFTVDCRFVANNAPGQAYMVLLTFITTSNWLWGTDTSILQIGLNHASFPNELVVWRNALHTGQPIMRAGVGVMDDQLHHVALSRSGDTLILFLDGVIKATYNLPSSGYNLSNATHISLGGGEVPSSTFYGQISWVRLVIGKVIYSNSFNPPMNVTVGNYFVSGVVNRDGVPISTRLIVHRRSDGQVQGAGYSGSDGSFNILLPNSEPVYIIAQDDRESRNALVFDRIQPIGV